MRDPFPLQWPERFTRTALEKRGRSRFGVRGQVSFSAARNDLLAELGRLGAANVVITSDLPVRHDGLPYAHGSNRVQDPGIAVWFVLDDAERVFACDRWMTHAENMQAIAKSVEAMRGLDRWGMADVVERVIGGFAALPPGSGAEYVPPPPPKPPRTWREVFSVPGVFGDHMKPAELLAFVKLRHREQIKAAHPDAGGSHELAAEINAALAAAEQELARG